MIAYISYHKLRSTWTPNLMLFFDPISLISAPQMYDP